jgi:hypothetical protein
MISKLGLEGKGPKQRIKELLIYSGPSARISKLGRRG